MAAFVTSLARHLTCSTLTVSVESSVFLQSYGLHQGTKLKARQMRFQT